MEKTLSEYLAAKPYKGFTPRPTYFRTGDYLTFFFDDAPAYEERVDDLLTVYRSKETDEMVGCKIKGVVRLLKELSEFSIEIDDGNVRLGLLFLAIRSIAKPGEKQDRIYDDLRRRVGAGEIPANELPQAA